MQLGNLILFVAMLAIVVTACVLGRRDFHRVVGGESPEGRRIRVRYGHNLGLIWLLCATGVMWGVDTGRLARALAVSIGVALVAAIGFALIWVSYQWFKVADEFHQKFMLESLSLGFGLTLIGIIAAQQLSHAAITPPLDSWGTLIIALFTSSVARGIVYLRYR